jgi:hypothetical protein
MKELTEFFGKILALPFFVIYVLLGSAFVLLLLWMLLTFALIGLPLIIVAGCFGHVAQFFWNKI